MSKLLTQLRTVACGLAVIASAGALASAQAPYGYLTISGSNVMDSTGLVPVANGTITFTPVNNSGVPIGYRATKVGGGYAQTTLAPVTATITNGAWSMQIADTALTWPVNVCFSVTATDNATGAQLLGPGLSCVQPAGSGTAVTGANAWCTASASPNGGTCNFDAYPPNLTALAVTQYGPQGPQGPQGPPGSSANIATGSQYQIPQYSSTSGIGPSNLTIDATGNNLNAPGTITAGGFSGPGTGLTGTAAALNIGGNAATATSATDATARSAASAAQATANAALPANGLTSTTGGNIGGAGGATFATVTAPQHCIGSSCISAWSPPAQTPHWTAMLQQVRTSSTPVIARVWVIGPSTTYGAHCDPTDANDPLCSYAGQEALSLNSTYGINATLDSLYGDGAATASFPGIPTFSNSDSRFTIGTSFAQDLTVRSVGYSTFKATASASPMTFSPIQSLGTPSPVDTFRVLYAVSPSFGTASANIDGGTPATQNTSGTSGVVLQTLTAFSGVGTHTLNVSQSAGEVHVIGMEAYDSTTSHVVFELAGSGSENIAQADDTSTGFGGGQSAVYSALGCDLAIIDIGGLGENYAVQNSGNTGAQNAAALATYGQALINALQSAGCDVILLSPWRLNPSNDPVATAQAPIYTAFEALVAANTNPGTNGAPLPFVDDYTQVLSYTWGAANGMYASYDNLHPSAKLLGIVASDLMASMAARPGAAYNAAGATAANTSWSGLTAPTGALSLAMTNAATTFTWPGGARTANDMTWIAGADTNSSALALFTFKDTTGNTSTAPLLWTATIGTSTALPFRATAQGTANGVQMTTAGLLQSMGTGGIAATQMPWDGITAPAGNLSIAMPLSTSTTFTWANGARGAHNDMTWIAGADTGSPANGIFTFKDTTGNTSTAPILWAASIGTSTAPPFQATAQGTANGIEVNSSGVLAAIGAGAINATTAATATNVAWSGLTNPTANMSLSMPLANTTTFTWAGGARGAANDMTWIAGADTGSPSAGIFTFKDTTGNTSTGPVLWAATIGTSTALPFQATAQGTANGVAMNSSGVLAAIGSGGITATQLTATSNSTLTTLPNLALPYTQLTGAFATGNTNGTFWGVSGGVQGYYAPAGSGTVNNCGTAGELAYYASTGTAVSCEATPTWNQNTTGTAANITATSNSTLTTLSALSLPETQVTGLGTGATATIANYALLAGAAFTGGVTGTTAAFSSTLAAGTSTFNSGSDASVYLDVAGDIICRNSTTANTNSICRVLGGAYSGNPLTMILTNSTSSSSILDIGGGTSFGEPATAINFYIGTQGTKAAGTNVASLSSTGMNMNGLAHSNVSSYSGTGTASFAAGAAAGSSPGTPTCTTSHVCDSFTGTISFTVGTATTTGALLTVTTGTTRTNQPSCTGTVYLAASPYTALPTRLTQTTTTIVFNVGTAPTASTAYELVYSGCGGN
jgi:hypothetical protein